MSSTLKKWPSDERNYFHYPHPTRCQWNNTKHLSQNLAEKWMDEDENQAYFSAFFLLFFHESHSPSPCLTLSQIGNWGFLHLRSLGIMLFHHHHGWCGSCCFFIILPLSKIFFCKKVNCFFGILKFSMNEEKRNFSGGLHIFTKVLNDSLLFSIIPSSLLPGVLVEFLTNWKLMLLVSS